MANYRKILKLMIPPVFPPLLVLLKNRNFSGNYANWEEALKDCSGEFSPDFYEKLRKLGLAVKNGKAEYTRDFTLFHEPQFNWPLLATLFKVANDHQGVVGVLDLGGSLGNVYYQHKKVLSKLKLRWCVVDTPKIVAIGREDFADNQLVFYEAISECISGENINIILLSGVLQCLQDPDSILDELLEKRAPAVVIDRTPFIHRTGRAKSNFLTVQKLPQEMANARAPHWFFDEAKFCDRFYRNGYRLIAQWKGYDWANIRGTEFKGLIFEQK